MAGNDWGSQETVEYAIVFRIAASGFRKGYTGEEEDKDGGE